MLKRIVALILAMLMMVACGSSEETETTSEASTENVSEEAVSTEEELDKTQPIKVAVVSGSTSSEVFNIAKENLEADGYAVELLVLSDYNAPNAAIVDGSADYNFYQHKPFLDAYNDSNGTNLKAASSGVYNMVFALVPGQINNLDDVTNGMKVVVPNDTSNRKIVMGLMQNAGLIKFDNTIELPTIADISENPHNLEFIELEETMIPGAVEDAGFGGISGSRWVASGRKIDEAIYQEPVESSTIYLVTREGNEDSALTKVIQEALCSPEVVEYLNTLDGAVAPIFE